MAPGQGSPAASLGPATRVLHTALRHVTAHLPCSLVARPQETCMSVGRSWSLKTSSPTSMFHLNGLT